MSFSSNAGNARRVLKACLTLRFRLLKLRLRLGQAPSVGDHPI